MIALQIDNPIIEKFYKEVCKNDTNKLIDSFKDYIENYFILNSVKKGFNEMKLQNEGKIEKKEWKDIIDEI